MWVWPFVRRAFIAVIALLVLSVPGLGRAQEVEQPARPAVPGSQPGRPAQSDRASVKTLYDRVGERYGITFAFDEKFKNTNSSVDLERLLEGATLRQSLERLGQAWNHFYKKVDERTYLVVMDTPQNRREYEDLVIRLFVLKNVPAKAVDRMLRIVIEARRLYADPDANTVMLRDTANKVKIAERLLSVIDRPPSELEIGVEVLTFEPGRLRQALARQGVPGQPATSMLHLKPGQLERIKVEGKATSTATTGLGLVGASRARYETGAPPGWVEVELEGTADSSTSEVTLTSTVSYSAPIGPSSAEVEARGGTVPHQTQTSTFRLQAGESALITGLGSGDHEVAVVLTPSVIRAASYTAADLEALWVGTESKISLDGLQLLTPTR